MLKSSARSVIRLRGVRHNNLKNFDLDLPLNQLIVITGLSGSGKSSLAFDTLFAEGQRRYIETFSPYARQFFDRMDKPQVDSIEGIPPAIAIEQRNAVKTTRSTVGTMTEICEYMKMLWPHVSQLHCRGCGQPVRKEPPLAVWEAISRETKATDRAATECLVTFELPLTEKLSVEECFALIGKQGYQRLLVDAEVIRLEDAFSRVSAHKGRPRAITVVQDRLKTSAARSRFMEACEQAYHFGKGKLTVWDLKSANAVSNPRFFSNRLHCATCDIEYREPSPALFSFNHPVGACPTCRGFGRVISIDYNLAIPDRSKSIAGGLIKPWQTGHGLESQNDLLRVCRQLEIPVNVPFEKLAKKWQKFVVEGDEDYGTDEEHEWPRAWYGVKGYFRWLESKAYKMHVRVLLSRYRAYTPCPDCAGQRFQPDSLLYRSTQRLNGHTTGLTLASFYQLPIRDALRFVGQMAKSFEIGPRDPIALVLHEVSSRLSYLEAVGLGYLTLDRPTRTLSGGETERVNLTTCLGTRLVNTLFVLDEPSVGLHPRDTERLVKILQQLRDAGNTVVVVEHEASVMRAADQIIDLGPGHGATGGEVVFQGPYHRLLRDGQSLTGQYLSGRKQVTTRARRAVAEPPYGLPNGRELVSAPLILNDARAEVPGSVQNRPTLVIRNASRHNLKNLTVEIPLARLVCVTGVSGSGKTTLIREVLLPAVAAKLSRVQTNSMKAERAAPEENRDESELPEADASGAMVEGWQNVDKIVLVDQSILGKTPRSNPAVYIGAFDDIREVFAQSEKAKQRGLGASAFSFNSGQGQCERCRGAGYEKIEMQFLSDVFIRCPECDGKRYRPHILQIKIRPEPGANEPRIKRRLNCSLSIADLLDSTIEEAIDFLRSFTESRAAQRAARNLALLEEVGLGYLKVGQPINTLSGGESQRLKLVRHLAESDVAETVLAKPRTATTDSAGRRTLFLFDEPTTGLHFHDVGILLKVFQRLVDSGHSVLVIEHNLDVIRAADWVIDLGPDAGDEGGEIMAQGTPELIAQDNRSHTGAALRGLLQENGAITTAV
jgi:excinuclease ABC subunit A